MVLLALFSPTKAAADPIGCQFTTASLKWEDATSRASYSTPAHSSVAAWNATATPVSLIEVTTGENVTVADGNFGATGFVGITRDNQGSSPPACTSSGYWRYGIVTWWNRYYTDGYNAGKRQSIMVHELGHGLGLAHTTSTSCLDTDIMLQGASYRYDVCGINTPKNNDIYWINVLY